ncbi:MAG: hypothetical protein AAFY41_15370, partial [Bacteroidota bacterium]
MRLGQFARKHDIPVQDIIAYLEEETGEKFHANAKIFDTLEEKVFTHFEIIPADSTTAEIASRAESALKETDEEPEKETRSTEPTIEETVPEKISAEQVPVLKTPPS